MDASSLEQSQPNTPAANARAGEMYTGVEMVLRFRRILRVVTDAGAHPIFTNF
jgi:hypothetical protein